MLYPRLAAVASLLISCAAAEKPPAFEVASVNPTIPTLAPDCNISLAAA